MIVVGSYLKIDSGGNRAPFVEGDVQSATGQWTPVDFLIDLGADATYLPASYIQRLQIDPTKLSSRSDTSGVGSGNLSTLQFLTQVRFVGEVEERVDTVEIGIFLDPTILDLPVLGRDLLNLFTLVCDEDQNLVYLLDGQDRQKVLDFLLRSSISL
jgi:hypothetical protein